MPQTTSRLSPGSIGKIPDSTKIMAQITGSPKASIRVRKPSGRNISKGWARKFKPASEERQVGNPVQEAPADRHFIEQLQRSHAVAVEVLGVLVDVHAHETPAGLKVDAPPELKGVGHGLVLVGDGVVDALAHGGAEGPDQLRTQVAPITSSPRGRGRGGMS